MFASGALQFAFEKATLEGKITIGGETWTNAEIVETERQPDGSADVTIEIPPAGASATDEVHRQPR